MATPETQRQQSVAPSGATQDANAHQEAQNDFNTNLGGALMDLVGATAKLGEGIKTFDKAEMARMRSENQLDADADLADLGSFMSTYIDEQEEGKSLSDYEPDELRSSIDDATQAFIKSKKLGDKSYFQILQQDIKAKSGVFFQKQTATNQKKQQEKRYGSMMTSVKGLFTASNDPAEIVEELNGLLDNVGMEPHTILVDGEEVEVNPSIRDTSENAKLRMVQPILQSVMEKRDPNALKLLESEEFKEFFDFPDYDNVIEAAKQQVQSTINKKRQLNFDRLEESGFSGVDSGLFNNEKDIKNFFKEQVDTMPEADRPDTKQLMKLEDDLLKSVATESTFQNMYPIIKGGDYTALDRSGMKEKEIKAMKNKFFTVETGIDDLSPQGISDAIKSGDYDSQIKSFFESGYALPPHLETWANTPPSGGIKGLRDKQETFIQLNSLTQDTSRTTLDLFKPKEYSRMMFAGNLIDNIDSGVMDDKEALQVYSTFNNDLNKNVDSFGIYTSSKAESAIQSEEVTEWLAEQSSDAPWTYDDFSGQAYIGRQFKNYFSYAMETTDDKVKAMELAEEMFYKRHTAFENPDGSEGVLPNEFLGFEPRDFTEIAHNLDDFKDIKEAAGFLGLAKDYDFESNLAFRPDPSYEKTKLMNFYYDDKFITSMSADLMRKNLEKINLRKVRNAERRNVLKTQTTK